MGAKHLKAVQTSRRKFQSRIPYEIAVVIASELDDDGGPAIVGYREIAERSGCSKNSVKPHLGRLIEDGVFKVFVRGREKLYFAGDSDIWASLATEDDGVQDRPNDCPNGVPMVSQSAEQLSQLVSQLSQLVSQLSQLVSQFSPQLSQDCPNGVPMAVESIGTVAPSYNNNNNNNYYYSEHTVPTSDETRLITVFMELTGFTPPHISSTFYGDEWEGPMAQVLAMSDTFQEAVARVTHGVDVARGNGKSGKRYIIRNPKSILTAALNYDAAKSPGGEGRFRILEGV